VCDDCGGIRGEGSSGVVAAIVLGTDYGTLVDKGIWFILVLLFGAGLIGLGEELMFRGIAVVALRQEGRTEPRVALLSAVLFGLAHTVNFFVDGGATSCRS
jgi:membrane protease YdiL (CAAX protease family)